MDRVELRGEHELEEGVRRNGEEGGGARRIGEEGGGARRVGEEGGEDYAEERGQSQALASHHQVLASSHQCFSRPSQALASLRH